MAITILAGAPAYAQSGAATPDGWVVLPVTEYTALKRAASPAAPDPEPPPLVR
ncbi:MAG: hypothetical protein ABR594_15465 [Pyrinomonadaceae bacterium]